MKKNRSISLIALVALALAAMPFAGIATGQWYDEGYFDDPGWYDNEFGNDWFYDTYDATFYNYGDYGAYDWYDYKYAGIYDEEWTEDDWYYDEYEIGHMDPWGYDDPGEEGFWDV